MLSFIGKLIFTVAILLTFSAFIIPVYKRFKIIRSGQPDKRFNNLARRLRQALSKILLQRCTLKNERLFTGFMHVFIFYGALTFDTITVNHTLEGFFSGFYIFGSSNFGLFFSFMADIFAILVITGVMFFMIKRFIFRPKAYATSPLDSGIIYVVLILITLSYFYFEVFSIAHHPESERLAFLGNYFAQMAQNSLTQAAITSHFQISWWLHILLVYGFIAYVPHSKYFHMFAGSFNLIVSSDRSTGELTPLDIEKSEVFGVEKATDYTWKDLLDSFACMECGRCQDACPAFASEKPLSPKMIILNLKKHLLKEKKNIIKNKLEDIGTLMDGVYTEGEIWTCTTCGACMHVCPVEIEHIAKIVGVRQSQVLMESKFPGELNNFFRNMESNSNPWGIGFTERSAWADDMDIKLIKDHPEVEYLFWVGCAGSFDEEGKKISRALVSILNEVGIEFAILGTEEKCCGDSARRLGNEYLFQTQASENIELFYKYKIKKIITICPHGFHTFKNEYPTLLNVLPEMKSDVKEAFKSIEVIHHTQLISRLIHEKRLQFKSNIDKVLTYHDSCYLGRHNHISDEPRKILSCINDNKLRELKNNKDHSFCCGAGGGMMWTEETLGKRINHLRTEEVIDSKAEMAVTSCPFCLTMLKDGLKDKNQENVEVKDIAQLVAEAIKQQ